jgi:hypothetical protein
MNVIALIGSGVSLPSIAPYFVGWLWSFPVQSAHHVWSPYKIVVKPTENIDKIRHIL